MRKRTTVIRDGQGNGVNTVTTPTGGCGCLTLFLAAVILFLPATWPPPWNVLAYTALGLLIVGSVVGLFARGYRRGRAGQ